MGTGPLLTEHWKFAAHGATYRQAKLLAKVLLRSLLSFKGPQGTVQVSGAYLRGEGDLSEPLPHGTLYSTHVEMDVVYTDAQS